MRSATRPYSRRMRRNVAVAGLSMAAVAGALLAVLVVGLAMAAPAVDPYSVEKTAELVKDLNGDGEAGPADRVEYTIVISNNGGALVEQLVVSDTLPPGTSYIPDSTQLQAMGTSAVPVPDDASGTPFPLDEGGLSLPDLAVNSYVMVTFIVRIDNPFPGSELSVTNVAFGVTPSATVSASVQTSISLAGFVYHFPINFAGGIGECTPPNGCPIPGRANGLAVHSGTGYVYVASREGNGAQAQALKVDPDDGTVLASAATGTSSKPWGVVVNENTNRVYVSNFGTNQVIIFDADTLTEIKRINIPGDGGQAASPGLMAILPALDTVFVVVRGGSRIGIIEGTNLVDIVPSGGSGPWGIAADPVRNYVYVSHRDSRSYSLLYQSGGSWVAETGPTFDASDGRQLFGLSYLPNSNANQPGLLYSSWVKDGDWFVGAWEPKKSGGNPATQWGQRTPKQVPSGGDVNSPDVGGDGIVVNPNSGNVFMANTGDDSVTVLGNSGSTYLSQTNTGDDPFPAAVDPATSRVYIGLRDGGAILTFQD